MSQPVKLRDDILPTKLDVFQHFLYVSQEKYKTGEWIKKTDFSVRAQQVRDDVEDLWNRTGIAHGLGGKEGVRRVTNLINTCRNTFKTPMARREPGFQNELKVLFDVALCKHSELHCPCDVQVRIPSIWKAFLNDQRGPRVLEGVLSSRKMSLRAATDQAKQVQEFRDMARFKMEQVQGAEGAQPESLPGSARQGR